MIHNSCPSRCFCTPQQLSSTGRDEEQSKTQEIICLLVLIHKKNNNQKPNKKTGLHPVPYKTAHVILRPQTSMCSIVRSTHSCSALCSRRRRCEHVVINVLYQQLSLHLQAQVNRCCTLRLKYLSVCLSKIVYAQSKLMESMKRSSLATDFKFNVKSWLWVILSAGSGLIWARGLQPSQS